MQGVASIIAIAILLFSPWQLAGQQSKKTFSLTIEGLQSSFMAGQEVRVRTKLTNISDHLVTIMDKRRDCDYPVKVTSADGTPAPLTNYGRDLNCSAVHVTSRDILIILKPGESKQDEIGISNVREMNKLGHYSVEVWREIPKTLGPDPIKSNTISITITK